MKRATLCILFSVLWLIGYAFSDRQAKAFDAFSKADYIEAARLQNAFTIEIEDALAAGQEMTPELFQSYIISIYNEGSYYYMVDDYDRLEQLAIKIASVTESYPHYVYEDLTKGNLTELGWQAVVYAKKINGMAAYGFTDNSSDSYNIAEYYYLECLAYPDPTATEFFDAVHSDLAQLYYKQGYVWGDYYCYYKAAAQLEAIKRQTPMLQSQKAIVKARQGQVAPSYAVAKQKLDEAVEEIDGALAQMKKKTAEYAETLRKKGKILMLRDERLGNKTGYKEARKCYEQYLDFQKKRIATEYGRLSESQRRQAWLALHQFIYDCMRLGPEGADLAYDVALYTKGYMTRPATEKVAGWRQVAKALPADGCAVEFAVVDDMLKAIIVNAESKKPQMVDVNKVSDIRNHEVTWYMRAGERIDDITAYYVNPLYQDETFALLIWTPQLLEAIGNKSKIYFSPDDILHSVAIEYIIPDSTKTAYRLSTTSRLLRPTRKIAADAPILLCGGIDYGHAEPSGLTYDKNDRVAYSFLKNLIDTIASLPGTLVEIDSIMAMRGNKADTRLTGSEATEDVFIKKVAGHPIVHVATHGFYAPENSWNTDLKPKVTDNSMSHSGLVFAGLLESLQNDNGDATRPDGILSAREIADHDLGGVQIMVLSACQTARGYVTVDGIYGLERGLKMAGVDGMIVSLWPVNDYATATMMNYFYDELKRNPEQSPHDAFMNARQQLIDLSHDGSSRFNAARLMHVIDNSSYYYLPQFCNPFITIDIF